MSADTRVYRSPLTTLTTKLRTVTSAKSEDDAHQRRAIAADERVVEEIARQERQIEGEPRAEEAQPEHERQPPPVRNDEARARGGDPVRIDRPQPSPYCDVFWPAEAAREHEQIRRHVAVERDRPQVLIRLGVIHVDGVAGDVDVQHLAVRARLEPHARAALEFRATGQLAVLQIELPEFVAADLLDRVRMPTLRPGASVKLTGVRRSEREEIHRLCRQVDPADPHRRTMLDRIGDGEERRVEARVVVHDVARVELEMPEPFLDRTRHVPLVHLRVVGGVVDQDSRAR